MEGRRGGLGLVASLFAIGALPHELACAPRDPPRAASPDGSPHREPPIQEPPAIAKPELHLTFFEHARWTYCGNGPTYPGRASAILVPRPPGPVELTLDLPSGACWVECNFLHAIEFRPESGEYLIRLPMTDPRRSTTLTVTWKTAGGCDERACFEAGSGRATLQIPPRPLDEEERQMLENFGFPHANEASRRLR